MIHKKTTKKFKEAQSQHLHPITMQKQFQVQAIRKKRIRDGIVQYYVKWKSFPQSQNTWECEAHFRDKEMLEVFNKQLELQNENTANRLQTAIRSSGPIISRAKRNPFAYHETKPLKRTTSPTQEEELQATTEKSFRTMSQNATEKDLSFDVPAPNMKIQGLYFDQRNNYWFKIINNRQMRMVSREDAIKMNFYAVIKFYEQNIKYYPS